MKRTALVALVALATTFAATASHAEGKGGIGFRSSTFTPIGPSASPTLGIRHWLNERVGVDAAFGFATLDQELTTTPTPQKIEGSGFAFDIGVPISAKKWDKVNFIVRPGFLYATANQKNKNVPTPPNEATGTLTAIMGEMEVEWMAAEWLGISAAHGIAYRSSKVEDNDSPANQIKTTQFVSTGNNFTTLGFHVYLW